MKVVLNLIQVSNSAAGCIKVPGVSYPDGSDFAKISKHIAWRASVQMSTSAAQLALHVLTFYIVHYLLLCLTSNSVVLC